MIDYGGIGISVRSRLKCGITATWSSLVSLGALEIDDTMVLLGLQKYRVYERLISRPPLRIGV